MSKIRFSKRIAGRYLWARRGEAFITIITVISVLGVALGVMVLNVTMAIMTGFEHEFREKIVGSTAHISVRKIGGRIDKWPEAAAKIQSTPQVVSVSPFTYHQALLRSEQKTSGLLIKGLAQGSDTARQIENYLDIPAAEKTEGMKRLFDPPKVEVHDEQGNPDQVKLPGIIIGRDLSRTLGILQGDVISLLSTQVGSSPFGLVPRFKRFVVVGIYTSGLVEYESGIAYLALEDAQNFFNSGTAISGLDVRVKSLEQAEPVASAILASLGGIQSGFIVKAWTADNQPLWDAMRLEKQIYFIVLLLIIVMASFSIVTTLIMIVLEKRRDIAMLKTMGASNASISNIFRIQGAVIGGIGVLLGLLMGLVGCIALREYGFPIDPRVFQMPTVPVRIEPLNFIVSGIAAFLICCVATWYPVRRAGRMDPAEVLRYE